MCVLFCMHLFVATCIVFVDVCACMCVSEGVYACTCIDRYSVCTHAHWCISLYVYVYVCHVYTYIYMYMQIHVYVCVCVSEHLSEHTTRETACAHVLVYVHACAAYVSACSIVEDIVIM